MKIYTVIGGINGAGKSSLTGVLKTERSDLGKIIDVDKLAVRLQEEYLREGISFTQETTLSGQRPLRMIREAKEAGYYVRLFYVGIGSVQEALKRIENRVSKGGHNIPEEDVLRRFGERNEALAKVLDYVDEAVLFDNENGFVAIAEYKNGELVLRGDYAPDWVKDLRRYLKGK